MILFGALLVLCAGTALGLSAYFSLRSNVTEAQRSLLLLERLHAEICIRRHSLPDALRALSCLDGETLEPCEQWRRFLKNLRLSEEGERPLAELGDMLRRGEEPEHAFSICRTTLERRREETETTLRQKGRLCVAFGVSGGCLLAILLI